MTEPRTHYIQVSGITIETITDAINDALDPAIFCPNNGFIANPATPYSPPFDMGNPATNEIYLLCSNISPGALSFYATVSMGKYFAEIYNSSGVLVATTPQYNTGTNVAYYFPTTVPNTYYSVRIKCTTGNFLSWKVAAISGLPLAWNIYQAKFNTPSITTLANAFQYIKAIKEVTFLSTLNSLTSMVSMFDTSGINIFTFPSSLPALLTVSGMFRYSEIVNIYWDPASSVPVLSILYAFVQDTSFVSSVQLPATMPELTDMANFARISSISTLRLPTSNPKLSLLTYSFATTPKLITPLTFAAAPLLTSLSNTFNASGVPSVAFTGPSNSLSLLVDTFRAAANITDVRFPSSLPIWVNTGVTFFNGANRLKNIILPDLISAVTLTTWPQTGVLVPVESITGNFANAACNTFQFTYSSVLLTTFNCPGMRCDWFSITAPKLTAIEINWTNSTFGGNCYLYCNLPAAELNRIFTALPIVVGKTIFIKGNSGTGTCNQAIATAKGWIVNTIT